MTSRLWIWVCGPYASGDASAEERAVNLRALNEAGLAVFRLGYLPVIGANMALPLIEVAGDDPASHDIRQPISFALMERCDACLRVGGPSVGADREVLWFREKGRVVYSDITDLASKA